MAINVMVNGLSKEKGKMTKEVAEHLLDSVSEFQLLPYSLTGSEVNEFSMMIRDNFINLIKPNQREEIIEGLKEVIIGEPFISVDFTHPNAVNDNADFYCRHNLPFVMGTTGGDRTALEQRVKDSDIVAVIAPNMAKQIVALQEFMEDFASRYTKPMKGYELRIRESHQQGKADTSATAKAMIRYFNDMGIEFEKSQIEMIRDPNEQRKLGVPEEFLGGHGWHSYFIHAPLGTDSLGIYRLTRAFYHEFLNDDDIIFNGYNMERNHSHAQAISPDKNVLFGFDIDTENNNVTITHNVNGRGIYAEGTLDAIKYLQTKIDAGEKGKVYSMMDIFEGN